ncbi:MAG: hypothetical protein WAN46_02555 [Gammaproteobacteria bacterium]
MQDSRVENSGGGSREEKRRRSCPMSIALISWGLILQGIGLLVLLIMLVICACEHFNEIADEFSGLATLLLLSASLILLIGVKLRQGSAWTRAVLLWVFPLPVLDGFLEGTRAPSLLVLLAAQYVMYVYVLTKPEVALCFRAPR